MARLLVRLTQRANKNGSVEQLGDVIDVFPDGQTFPGLDVEDFMVCDLPDDATFKVNERVVNPAYGLDTPGEPSHLSARVVRPEQTWRHLTRKQADGSGRWRVRIGAIRSRMPPGKSQKTTDRIAAVAQRRRAAERMEHRHKTWWRGATRGQRDKMRKSFRRVLLQRNPRGTSRRTAHLDALGMSGPAFAALRAEAAGMDQHDQDVFALRTGPNAITAADLVDKSL